MRIARALGTLAVVVLVMGLGAQAEAQLAKQGTYTLHSGWHGEFETFELEEGHVVIVGKGTGAQHNAAGKGFLHQTSSVCPFQGEFVNGIPKFHGYCIVQDHDGDKAFMEWQQACTADQPACEDTFQWTGGTGKYTGITGNNTFTNTIVPGTTSGASIWKGEWQLP